MFEGFNKLVFDVTTIQSKQTELNHLMTFKKRELNVAKIIHIFNFLKIIYQKFHFISK
jgi:hypothetical protein